MATTMHIGEFKDQPDDLILGGDTQTIADDVFRLRFNSLVLGDGLLSKVVLVCAESGMGKTHLAQSLLRDVESKGAYVRTVNLAGLRSGEATRKLVQLARELRVATKERMAFKAVLVDNVPVFDECDVRRASRALQRMASMNALVVACMLPEAESLAEELPKQLRLGSLELAAIYSIRSANYTMNAQVNSRGIAALVMASQKPSGDGGATDGGQQAWNDALAEVASRMIRETLPCEECDLRLAMMLLGEGGFDELREAVHRVDYDTTGWMARTAPFFGIDQRRGTFSCCGLATTEGIEACVPSLKEWCAAAPAVVACCCEVLARRRDFARLSVVCQLCDGPDLARIGTDWGVELVCEGNVPVVRKALALCEEHGFSPRVSHELARRAVEAMDDPHVTMKGDALSLVDGEGGQMEEKALIVDLLCACRNLDKGITPRIPMIWQRSSAMTQELQRHVKARGLLLSGRIADAYALLVNDPARLTPYNLPSALLCDDFQIAQLLMGETPRAEELEAFREAHEVMVRLRIERLVCYQELIGSMLQVLAGRTMQLPGVEAGVARAARMGDEVIRAFMLLSLAVLDNRSGAYARAHVRAVQVKELLLGTGGQHLQRVAQFTDALTALALEDERPLASLARSEDDSAFRDLAALFMCQNEEEAAEVELTTLSRTSCPNDVLWLLNVLINDFGGRSQTFREVVPRPWAAASRRAVRKVEAMAKDGQEALVARTAHAEADTQQLASPSDGTAARSAPHAPKRIEVRVLGDFELRINGGFEVGMNLSRRRSRSLLTFLALCKRHCLKRFELIECIWPDCDFESGRQRVYEATSFIRTKLAKVTGVKDFNPFVINKSQATIAFNPELVTCDVDRFEEISRDALASDDDAHIVELVRKAMDIYRGDLCETPYDHLQIAEARRTELRDLYVDIAVAGAVSAMREDLYPLAVRMAWAGHAKSGLREDAVLVLMEALKGSGRISDAREVYHSYAKRLLEETGEPPSASLRSAAGRMLQIGRARRRSVVRG